MSEDHEYDGPEDVCPNCGGEGRVEDCFEDTCVCLDPPCCWARCDWCSPSKPAAPTPEDSDV